MSHLRSFGTKLGLGLSTSSVGLYYYFCLKGRYKSDVSSQASSSSTQGVGEDGGAGGDSAESGETQVIIKVPTRANGPEDLIKAIEGHLGTNLSSDGIRVNGKVLKDKSNEGKYQWDFDISPLESDSAAAPNNNNESLNLYSVQNLCDNSLPPMLQTKGYVHLPTDSGRNEVCLCQKIEKVKKGTDDEPEDEDDDDDDDDDEDEFDCECREINETSSSLITWLLGRSRGVEPQSESGVDQLFTEIVPPFNNAREESDDDDDDEDRHADDELDEEFIDEMNATTSNEERPPIRTGECRPFCCPEPEPPPPPPPCPDPRFDCGCIVAEPGETISQAIRLQHGENADYGQQVLVNVCNDERCGVGHVVTTFVDCDTHVPEGEAKECDLRVEACTDETKCRAEVSVKHARLATNESIIEKLFFAKDKCRERNTCAPEVDVKFVPLPPCDPQPKYCYEKDIEMVVENDSDCGDVRVEYSLRNCRKVSPCPDGGDCGMEGEVLIEAFTDESKCVARIEVENGCPIPNSDPDINANVIEKLMTPEKPCPPPTFTCDTENPVVRVIVEKKSEANCSPGKAQSCITTCVDSLLPSKPSCPGSAPALCDSLPEDECTIFVDVDIATRQAHVTPACNSSCNKRRQSESSLIDDAADAVCGKKKKLTCKEPHIELRITDSDECDDGCGEINVELEMHGRSNEMLDVEFDPPEENCDVKFVCPKDIKPCEDPLIINVDISPDGCPEVRVEPPKPKPGFIDKCCESVMPKPKKKCPTGRSVEDKKCRASTPMPPQCPRTPQPDYRPGGRDPAPRSFVDSCCDSVINAEPVCPPPPCPAPPPQPTCSAPPAKPTSPPEHAKPTCPAEPAKPKCPAEPAKPTCPAEPAKPTCPAEPKPSNQPKPSCPVHSGQQPSPPKAEEKPCPVHSGQQPCPPKPCPVHPAPQPCPPKPSEKPCPVHPTPPPCPPPCPQPCPVHPAPPPCPSPCPPPCPPPCPQPCPVHPAPPPCPPKPCKQPCPANDPCPAKSEEGTCEEEPLCPDDPKLTTPCPPEGKDEECTTQDVCCCGSICARLPDELSRNACRGDCKADPPICFGKDDGTCIACCDKAFEDPLEQEACKEACAAEKCLSSCEKICESCGEIDEREEECDCEEEEHECPPNPRWACEPFQPTIEYSCDCFPKVRGKRPCDLELCEVPDFPGKKPSIIMRTCTSCKVEKMPREMYDWSVPCPLVPDFPSMKVSKHPAKCNPDEVPDFPGRCKKGPCGERIVVGCPTCIDEPQPDPKVTDGIRPFVEQAKLFCSQLCTEARKTMNFQDDEICEWDDTRLCPDEVVWRGCGNKKPECDRKMCLRLVEWKKEAKYRRCGRPFDYPDLPFILRNKVCPSCPTLPTRKERCAAECRKACGAEPICRPPGPRPKEPCDLISGPSPTNKLSCDGTYPQPKLIGGPDDHCNEECGTYGTAAEMDPNDPWAPTYEDYLVCPPKGWEWVEVDECCPPPPNIHACDPKCKPPKCPPWEAAKEQAKADKKRLRREKKAQLLPTKGKDGKTDDCLVGRCDNCGLCGCTCLKKKGFCDCDGTTGDKCGAAHVIDVKCALGITPEDFCAEGETCDDDNLNNDDLMNDGYDDNDNSDAETIAGEGANNENNAAELKSMDCDICKIDCDFPDRCPPPCDPSCGDPYGDPCCQGPCVGSNADVVEEDPETFEWCIDCVVKHSVEYHLGKLPDEIDDADLKLDICKWCPELEEANPCNCTGNRWDEETEEEELEDIICGIQCPMEWEDVRKEDIPEDCVAECPYPPDDPAWDDPDEECCEDDGPDCEKLAKEHEKIVKLKKHELREKIKHMKMAERIRCNIVDCQPVECEDDECHPLVNGSCNNDGELPLLANASFNNDGRLPLSALANASCNNDRGESMDMEDAENSEQLCRDIQRQIRASLVSRGVLCGHCGKKKKQRRTAVGNENWNSENAAPSPPPEEENRALEIMSGKNAERIEKKKKTEWPMGATSLEELERNIGDIMMQSFEFSSSPFEENMRTDWSPHKQRVYRRRCLKQFDFLAEKFRRFKETVKNVNSDFGEKFPNLWFFQELMEKYQTRRQNERLMTKTFASIADTNANSDEATETVDISAEEPGIDLSAPAEEFPVEKFPLASEVTAPEFPANEIPPETPLGDLTQFDTEDELRRYYEEQQKSPGGCARKPCTDQPRRKGRRRRKESREKAEREYKEQQGEEIPAAAAPREGGDAQQETTTTDTETEVEATQAPVPTDFSPEEYSATLTSLIETKQSLVEAAIDLAAFDTRNFGVGDTLEVAGEKSDEATMDNSTSMTWNVTDRAETSDDGVLAEIVREESVETEEVKKIEVEEEESGDMDRGEYIAKMSSEDAAPENDAADNDAAADDTATNDSAVNDAANSETESRRVEIETVVEERGIVGQEMGIVVKGTGIIDDITEIVVKEMGIVTQTPEEIPSEDESGQTSEVERETNEEDSVESEYETGDEGLGDRGDDPANDEGLGDESFGAKLRRYFPNISFIDGERMMGLGMKPLPLDVADRRDFVFHETEEDDALRIDIKDGVIIVESEGKEDGGERRVTVKNSPDDRLRWEVPMTANPTHNFPREDETIDPSKIAFKTSFARKDGDDDDDDDDDNDFLKKTKTSLSDLPPLPDSVTQEEIVSSMFKDTLNPDDVAERIGNFLIVETRGSSSNSGGSCGKHESCYERPNNQRQETCIDYDAISQKHAQSRDDFLQSEQRKRAELECKIREAQEMKSGEERECVTEQKCYWKNKFWPFATFDCPVKCPVEEKPKKCPKKCPAPTPVEESCDKPTPVCAMPAEPVCEKPKSLCEKPMCNAPPVCEKPKPVSEKPKCGAPPVCEKPKSVCEKPKCDAPPVCEKAKPVCEKPKCDAKPVCDKPKSVCEKPKCDTPPVCEKPKPVCEKPKCDAKPACDKPKPVCEKPKCETQPVCDKPKPVCEKPKCDTPPIAKEPPCKKSEPVCDKPKCDIPPVSKEPVCGKPKSVCSKPKCDLPPVSKEPVCDKPKPVCEKPKCDIPTVPKEPVCAKPKPVCDKPQEPVCEKPCPKQEPICCKSEATEPVISQKIIITPCPGKEKPHYEKICCKNTEPCEAKGSEDICPKKVQTVIITPCPIQNSCCSEAEQAVIKPKPCCNTQSNCASEVNQIIDQKTSCDQQDTNIYTPCPCGDPIPSCNKQKNNKQPKKETIITPCPCQKTEKICDRQDTNIYTPCPCGDSIPCCNKQKNNKQPKKETIIFTPCPCQKTEKSCNNSHSQKSSTIIMTPYPSREPELTIKPTLIEETSCNKNSESQVCPKPATDQKATKTKPTTCKEQKNIIFTPCPCTEMETTSNNSKYKKEVNITPCPCEEPLLDCKKQEPIPSISSNKNSIYPKSLASEKLEENSKKLKFDPNEACCKNVIFPVNNNDSSVIKPSSSKQSLEVIVCNNPVQGSTKKCSQNGELCSLTIQIVSREDDVEQYSKQYSENKNFCNKQDISVQLKSNCGECEEYKKNGDPWQDPSTEKCEVPKKEKCTKTSDITPLPCQQKHTCEKVKAAPSSPCQQKPPCEKVKDAPSSPCQQKPTCEKVKDEPSCEECESYKKIGDPWTDPDVIQCPSKKADCSNNREKTQKPYDKENDPLTENLNENKLIRTCLVSLEQSSKASSESYALPNMNQLFTPCPEETVLIGTESDNSCSSHKNPRERESGVESTSTEGPDKEIDVEKDERTPQNNFELTDYATLITPCPETENCVPLEKPSPMKETLQDCSHFDETQTNESNDQNSEETSQYTDKDSLITQCAYSGENTSSDKPLKIEEPLQTLSPFLAIGDIKITTPELTTKHKTIKEPRKPNTSAGILSLYSDNEENMEQKYDLIQKSQSEIVSIYSDSPIVSTSIELANEDQANENVPTHFTPEESLQDLHYLNYSPVFSIYSDEDESKINQNSDATLEYSLSEKKRALLSFTPYGESEKNHPFLAIPKESDDEKRHDTAATESDTHGENKRRQRRVKLQLPEMTNLSYVSNEVLGNEGQPKEGITDKESNSGDVQKIDDQKQIGGSELSEQKEELESESSATHDDENIFCQSGGSDYETDYSSCPSTIGDDDNCSQQFANLPADYAFGLFDANEQVPSLSGDHLQDEYLPHGGDSTEAMCEVYKDIGDPWNDPCAECCPDESTEPDERLSEESEAKEVHGSTEQSTPDSEVTVNSTVQQGKEIVLHQENEVKSEQATREAEPSKVASNTRALENPPAHNATSQQAVEDDKDDVNFSNSLKLKKEMKTPELEANFKTLCPAKGQTLAQTPFDTVLKLDLSDKRKKSCCPPPPPRPPRRPHNDDCGCHQPCPVFSEMVLGPSKECCAKCIEPEPVPPVQPKCKPNCCSQETELMVECYGCGATEEDALAAIKRHLGVDDSDCCRNANVVCRVLPQNGCDANRNAAKGEDEGEEESGGESEEEEVAKQEVKDSKKDAMMREKEGREVHRSGAKVDDRVEGPSRIRDAERGKSKEVKKETDGRWRRRPTTSPLPPNENENHQRKDKGRRLVIRRGTELAKTKGKPNQVLNLFNKFKNYWDKPSLVAENSSNNNEEDGEKEESSSPNSVPVEEPVRDSTSASSPSTDAPSSADATLCPDETCPVSSVPPLPLSQAGTLTLDFRRASAGRSFVEIPVPPDVVVRTVDGKVVFERKENEGRGDGEAGGAAVTESAPEGAERESDAVPPKSGVEEARTAKTTTTSSKATKAEESGKYRSREGCHGRARSASKSCPRSSSRCEHLHDGNNSHEMRTKGAGRHKSRCMMRTGGAWDSESLKQMGIYATPRSGIDIKREAIAKLSQNYVEKQQAAVVQADQSSLDGVDELFAQSSTSGASLALARRFEQLALAAMRNGDATLTVRLLREAIIHHPDPKAYVETLRSKQIPTGGETRL